MKLGGKVTKKARLTLKHAQQSHGATSKEVDAVRTGWETVKVKL